MRFLSRIILSVCANALALMAVVYFVKGFAFEGDFIVLLSVATIFTLVNTFIKPIVKFIFTPLIFLTFGLFLFFINCLILYSVDFFSEAITISGLRPLLFSTLIISCVNILINFAAKFSFRRNKEII